jgi:hypothetical protein
MSSGNGDSKQWTHGLRDRTTAITRISSLNPVERTGLAPYTSSERPVVQTKRPPELIKPRPIPAVLEQPTTPHHAQALPRLGAA